MLLAILITNSSLRDAIVGRVSGVKQTHTENAVTFYQKNNYIFAFSDSISHQELFETTLKEYQPEKVFFTEVGRSVDVDHEIGDIVLPNVFFQFHDTILQTEISQENRDSLIGKAQFLEIFEEQKDYFVEDFWLSIGGIVVENVPKDADAEKLMSVYEADIYIQHSLQEVTPILQKNLVPTLLLVWIIEGKIGKYDIGKPYHQVASNILTTIRLLNEEESL